MTFPFTFFSTVFQSYEDDTPFKLKKIFRSGNRIQDRPVLCQWAKLGSNGTGHIYSNFNSMKVKKAEI